MSAKIGIAHAGAHYTPGTPATSGSTLNGGAGAIASMGAKVIKAYLSPEYATNYSADTFGGGISNLTDLAQTSQYSTFFSNVSFTTFIMNTWTFANGTSDPWRSGVTATMLDNERAEMKNLTTHLLTTYSGTGKTFILQNWESDWAYLGVADPTVEVPVRRAEYYQAFLRARHEGIESARREVGQDNVRVLHGIEVNRVLDAVADPANPRVVNTILPKVKFDIVSYSAYDSTVFNFETDQEDTMRSITETFTRATNFIRDNIPEGTPIYIGEFGFAENELPAGHNMSDLVRHVYYLASNMDYKYAIYWQLYDNECDGPSPGQACRGFWIVEPDGTTSGAGTILQSLI